MERNDINLIDDVDTEEESVFVSDDDAYNKKIKPVPTPEKSIGIDTNNDFYRNIIEASQSSKLDMTKIDAFSQISQNRETIYQLLDTMGEDEMISAILEIYTEDATEAGDTGRVVWCESDDAEIAKFVTFLLDSMNVDKSIYKWTYALCKYGDLYLRLYRNSDFKDKLFEDDEKESKKLNEELSYEDSTADKETLNEDVIVKAYDKNDKYAHYVEMVPNPAEMFELTKFGKSYAYIKAPVGYSGAKINNMYTSQYKYSFKKKDVELYQATEFVHAALEDNTSRIPEEVNIFLNDSDYTNNENALSYNVRRGQSLLYNSFKIWRELKLLENSMLLNRLTKSSILRVINVEVGDMPKEQVGPHLMGIKNMIEQKSALDTNTSMQEYTNPGPMENNIYVPTHNQIGAITTQEIGGDVEVKGLEDVDYFKNKFYGAMRVPKQYLGDTDDATGFNGGTSLSIVSSRYAKAVKRIQATLIQAITDAVNLMLLDKGLGRYVNKFDICMQPPTTQEEMDRRDNISAEISSASDIMNLLSPIEDTQTQLRILKILLSHIISEPEVIEIIQEEIDRLEKELESESIESSDDEFSDDLFNNQDDFGDIGSGGDFGDFDLSDNDIEEPSETPEENTEEETLPTGADLGIDLTDNNAL